MCADKSLYDYHFQKNKVTVDRVLYNAILFYALKSPQKLCTNTCTTRISGLIFIIIDFEIIIKFCLSQASTEIHVSHFYLFLLST